MDISIGKYTLESLTSGMYLEPLSLYKEYIQNAVDSLDEAVEAGLLQKEDGQVLISVDRENRQIVIEDCSISASPKRPSPTGGASGASAGWWVWVTPGK
jgi:molecular chaperone HtpG